MIFRNAELELPDLKITGTHKFRTNLFRPTKFQTNKYWTNLYSTWSGVRCFTVDERTSVKHVKFSCVQVTSKILLPKFLCGSRSLRDMLLKVPSQFEADMTFFKTMRKGCNIG